MPSLKPLDPQSTPELNDFWHLVVARRSRVLPLDRLLAHSPEMGTRWHDMAHGLRTQITISPRLCEALILRTVTREQARFAQQAHIALGQQTGLTDSDVTFLCGGEAAGADPEVAFHGRLAEAIAATTPDHDVVDEAVERYGERYAVEAMLVVGFYRMVSTVTKALQLDR